MDEFWGIVVVLFVVLTILVVVFVRMASYYKEYNGVRHKRVLLSAVRGGLKSGDVILFIAHTHGFTNSIFTWDLYSHSGMVVEDGGRLYITESTVESINGDDKAPESSQTNELFRRLDEYPGGVFLMRLRCPLTPEQEKTLRACAREEIPYPSMLHALQAAVGLASHKRARHCMQHVGWLLDEMGLTPDYLAARGKTLHGTGFLRSSRAVTGLPGRPLGGGANAYEKIVELLCDWPPEREAGGAE